MQEEFSDLTGGRHIAVSGFLIIRQEAGDGVIRLFPDKD